MPEKCSIVRLPVALTVAALFMTASLSWGQLGVGSISGRVTDPTGAVIPGASALILNTDTNFTYNSSTNEEGMFRVPSLQPGPYRVEIEMDGFKR